mgnify:FL=1|jgi:hypothetical protein
MPMVPSHIEIDEIKEKHIESEKIDTKSKHIIPYKDWEIKQKSASVYEVPIEYCKYRLDNGRIKTQILTHLKVIGKLKPNDDETQKVISEYLGKSDPKTNEDLKKILKKEGQKDPAVMTADGFLINGNRRKWAFEQLLKEYPEEKYKKLKVVILPGSNDPERPTVKDIAILENRFQVYLTGKSEYSKMNKALTYYTNTKNGISLEELLKDDPTFGDNDNKKFQQKIKKFKKEYFEPIKLMDEYLETYGTKGDYNRVANRWMSFEELGKNVTSNLDNQKFLVEHNIDKKEVGSIKSAAFNIIKLKDSSEVAADNRYLIRGLPRWIKAEKKDVLKIGNIDDVSDHIKDPDERDREWQHTKAEEVINLIKKLENLSTRMKDQLDPLNRLNEALGKLTHEDLDANQLEQMKIPDVKKAFDITKEIENKNNELKSFLYNLHKNSKDPIKKLKKKFNS